MGPDRQAALIAEAWAAVSADRPEQGGPGPEQLEVVGPAGQLPSAFPAEETAVACVGAALLAAAALLRRRGGSVPRITVDRAHVAAAVRSERYFRRGGVSAGAGFAPLSRFWRTADGWVRTHANYPWHRAALLSALGVAPDADAVAAAMAGLRSGEVERMVFAAGGIAAEVRPLDAWRAHPQGRALAGEALVAHSAIDNAAPRPRPRPAPDRPADGVRVLDLTRVIAGPVCTRYLGALGADVVRLDPPGHPDMHPGDGADTLLGKRSALVDLGSRSGAATVSRLLEQADVVVSGYRPGALDRFGLGPAALAERAPGLVVVSLDAWGHTGPWAGRRGFDSIVQAATGIAVGEAVDADPGTLPCQLLDHGTGYLAAAAALEGLRRQADRGGTHFFRLSLAGTAWWLTAGPAAGPVPAGPPPAAGTADPPWLAEVDSTGGGVIAVTPPGRLGDQPLRWPFPLTGYGDDAPAWSDPRPARR